MTATGRGRPPSKRATARRTLLRNVVLALIVTMLIAAVVGTIAITDSDDEAADATTTTEPVELEGAAAELAGLLEERQDQTYHARYEGQSGDSSTVVIETWQDGEGQVRQDQILSAGEQGAHLVTIDAADGQVRCTRLAADEWTCRRAAPGEIGQSDLLATIRSRLAEGEVSARDSQIDGEPARCFELDAEGETSELCVRSDTGIPVRIAGGTTELRLLLFEETVDPAVFEPPGPVTG